MFEQSSEMTLINQEAEKDLNSKILEITLKIYGKYHGLSKYIEDMPVTIPDETKSEITL